MKSFSVAAIMALVTAALAQRAPEPNPDFNAINKPEEDETVKAGTTYTIVWQVPDEFADVLVNLILVGGRSQKDLGDRLNITTGGVENSGEYDWKIPSDVVDLPINGLRIESVENPNVDYQWSMPFHIAEDPNASGPLSASSSESNTRATSAASDTAASSTDISTTTTTDASSSVVPSSSEVESSAPATITSTPIFTPTTVASSEISQSPTESGVATVSDPPGSGTTHVKAGVLAVLGGVAVALAL
ncbi:hypothetical protein ACHAQA_007245 [Verticillium albo-atrum]